MKTTEKLTMRSAKAAENHTLGLPVSVRMYLTMEMHGLAQQHGYTGEWSLTEAGCDLAARRTTIRRGQIVRADRRLSR